MSIFALSKVYLDGGAGVSDETVKFEVKNVPSKIVTSVSYTHLTLPTKA